MKLGILLTAGDSLTGMEKSGQLIRFRKYYLKEYTKNFEEVYIFSYQNERKLDLPANVHLVHNKYRLHRYLYGMLLPLLNFNTVSQCDVFRVFHISGTIPAIITKIFFRKPFIFNFAYDYEKFAKIDNKILPGILFKVFTPLTILFADKILAANKKILQQLPTLKRIYLPNGVDTEVFRPLCNKKKPKTKIRILSVGRLEKQKNFSSLIKALAGLAVKLTLVGNGILKQELIDLASREKVDLEIIEKIDNDQMPKIYNQADIFVLPSLIEGHPKVLLEAMACSLPVIGTNTEGINEIIEDRVNGILCQPNSDSIRSAVQLLMRDNAWRVKISLQARQTIVQNYDLNKLLMEEVSVIKSLGQ